MNLQRTETVENIIEEFEKVFQIELEKFYDNLKKNNNKFKIFLNESNYKIEIETLDLTDNFLLEIKYKEKLKLPTIIKTIPKKIRK